MRYYDRIDLALPYDRAVARVTDELKAQGFGIITQIDVQATLREKLQAETEPYVILGACNPALAKQAIDTDRALGLLLPCNVVVRAAAESGHSVVELLDPQVMVQVPDNGDDLKPVADEAGRRLSAVAQALRG